MYPLGIRYSPAHLAISISTMCQCHTICLPTYAASVRTTYMDLTAI
jgi:hypothetical protein